MSDRDRLLAVARAEAPADIVITGGQLVNVFSGEIERADLAICGERIAAIGHGFFGKTCVDLDGAFVAPGLIDAHVHIESSLCLPPEFAAAVVPRGVTTAVIDPHELANVVGAAGVRYMAEASQNLPMNVVVMGPSCVPATSMATAGGEVTATDLTQLLHDGVIHGLAEAMDFPGVIAGKANMRAKCDALQGRPIDGHCPELTGPALCAYVAAGVGSDHEAVTAEEAKEKLARGLYLLVREATNARNLDALLPMITPANNRRVCFCTDDRTPVDLLKDGSIDMMVRRAIAAGIDPVDAIRIATLNPSEWLGLSHLGAIAPGRMADLFVFDNLSAPAAKHVYHRGRRVAANGSLHKQIETITMQPPQSRCDVDLDSLSLDIPAIGKTIRVIGSIPDQLITEERLLTARIENNLAVADTERDLLKIAVIERHRGTDNIGLGFIQGFGFGFGAIAGTVAHDHHNLIVIGADDTSMRTAIKSIHEMGGGLASCNGDQTLAKLPMPIGGLMSDRPIALVAKAYEELLATAKNMGSTLNDPFMALSFMGLEVIPKLKLTDQGLVDVDVFEHVPLFID